jgi:hypothetical protein
MNSETEIVSKKQVKELQEAVAKSLFEDEVLGMGLFYLNVTKYILVSNFRNQDIFVFGNVKSLNTAN